MSDFRIRPPSDYDVVHLAAVDYVDTLVDELRWRGASIARVEERLVFARGAPATAAWAANSWLAPCEIDIDSIGAGAKALRSLQRNWVLHSLAAHRRARLIADKLPAIRFRPLAFGEPAPDAPLGAWTLLARDRIVASPHTSNPFADGVACFVEDRRNPPNRAYLKLWEALTLARRYPQPGERCLDLGAAPGGWSWVLAECGADVVSVDRAALSPTLADHPRITHRRADAFAVARDDIGPVDWICSDLIAYPERLLELARYWCNACPHAAVIVTIKCQGTVDAALIGRFYAIEGARLLHLTHNKHELTFFRLPDGGPVAGASGWRIS